MEVLLPPFRVFRNVTVVITLSLDMFDGDSISRLQPDNIPMQRMFLCVAVLVSGCRFSLRYDWGNGVIR